MARVDTVYVGLRSGRSAAILEDRGEGAEMTEGPVRATCSDDDGGWDDSALVDALALGSSHALRTLHDRYAASVYWTARSILGNGPDAEDATQDAFVLLWQKSSSLALRGGSALPWLLASVRFIAANASRSRERRERRVMAQARPHTDGREDEAEEAVLVAEAMETVRAQVRALSPVDREVYRLCVEDNLSYKQAASRLRLTHASVRNRLARVRANLRKALNQ